MLWRCKRFSRRCWQLTYKRAVSMGHRFLPDHAAASPASTDNPGGNNDPDIHCKLLCVQGGPTFAETPGPGTAWTTATTSTLLRWAVTDNPVPDPVGLIGVHARGPPLLS